MIIHNYVQLCMILRNLCKTKDNYSVLIKNAQLECHIRFSDYNLTQHFDTTVVVKILVISDH